MRFNNEKRQQAYETAPRLPTDIGQKLIEAYETVVGETVAADDQAGSDGTLSQPAYRALDTLVNLTKILLENGHLGFLVQKDLPQVLLDVGRHVGMRGLEHDVDPSAALVYGMHIALRERKRGFDLAQAVVDAGYFSK